MTRGIILYIFNYFRDKIDFKKNKRFHLLLCCMMVEDIEDILMFFSFRIIIQRL